MEDSSERVTQDGSLGLRYSVVNGDVGEEVRKKRRGKFRGVYGRC